MGRLGGTSVSLVGLLRPRRRPSCILPVLERFDAAKQPEIGAKDRIQD
jgi:hypothetical protein